jgi:glycosyltransferase involved in cell wall biosynthesis
MASIHNAAETTKNSNGNRMDKTSSKKGYIEEETKLSLDMPKENPPANIICLLTSKWKGMHLSDHHMAVELAKMGNVVVYVSSPLDLTVSLKNLLIWKNPHPIKGWLKSLNLLKKPARLKKNFFLARNVPLLLGFGFWGIIDRLNEKLIWWHLRHLARKLNMDEYVLYTSACFPTKIEDKRCKLFVYDCQDDLSCMTSIRKRRLRLKDLESRMLKHADLFFAISRSLFSEKSKISPHGFYLPPCIDLNRFTGYEENRAFKKSLEDLGRPLIGLLAAMSDQKIDWDALLYAATHRPDYKFILAGRVVGKIPEALANLENVFYLGPQKDENLPTLFHSFDVGLIPFNRNAFGNHAFPTKMPEYLFFGMPVVTTDLPNLREYEGIIEIARDKKEFAEKIDKCLVQNHDRDSFEKRRQVARNFSKEKRAQQIVQQMEKIWEMRLTPSSEIRTKRLDFSNEYPSVGIEEACKESKDFS